MSSEATGNSVAARKLAKNKPIYPYSKVISKKKPVARLLSLE
jgi:hypothetical protein